jgi:hypothetical protein
MRLRELVQVGDEFDARMRSLRPMRVRVEFVRCAGRCRRCTWIVAGRRYCPDCLTWMAAHNLRPRRRWWRK